MRKDELGSNETEAMWAQARAEGEAEALAEAREWQGGAGMRGEIIHQCEICGKELLYCPHIFEQRGKHDFGTVPKNWFEQVDRMLKPQPYRDEDWNLQCEDMNERDFI
jgi:hypothetical protein